MTSFGNGSYVVTLFCLTKTKNKNVYEQKSHLEALILVIRFFFKK